MLRIVCFAEAPADARLGSDLGDRVLAEEGPTPVDAARLPEMRVWTGLEPDQAFTRWTDIKQANGQARRPRYIGHAATGPRGSDYAMAVKALIQVKALASTGADTLAVVMLRDCDATPDKRVGLRQAAAESRFTSLNVIVGIADKMREAWVLNGFMPRGEAEKKTLQSLKTALSFDPTREAERLRAAKQSDLRHPKRVLSELTAADAGRQACCWLETPLDELRQRGAGTGLAVFLDELRSRLAPLIAR